MLKKMLFVLLVSTLAASGHAWGQGPVIRGDVNHDGKVTAEDALLVLSSVAGRPIPAEVRVRPNGDANDDQRLTAVDILMILNYAAKRGPQHPMLGIPIYTLTVDTDTLNLVPGQSRALVARVAGGSSGVSWRSASPSIARIDSKGMVTAVSAGLSRITAVAQADTTQKKDVTIRVAAEAPKTLSITPSEYTFSARGVHHQFSLAAEGASGKAIAVSQVRWTSSDSLVARVDASGQVTSVGAGVASITATSGGARATAQVKVAPAVASVMIAPRAVALEALGDTARLSLSAKDSNGSAVPVCKATWTSRAPEIATVGASGLVTAKSIGKARIIVGCVTGEDSVEVTVSQTIASVSVTPSVLSLMAGDTARLKGLAADAGHTPVAGAAFVWTSSAPAIVSVDASGHLTARKMGAALVIISSAGKADTARVTVAATAAQPLVTSLAISPAAPMLKAIGQSLDLSAVAKSADGKAVACPLVWSSSNPSVVAVDSAGKITSRTAGTVRVIAACGTVADTVSAQVQQAVVSVSLYPSELTLEVGKSDVLVASAQDANGHAIPNPIFTWTSSNSAVVALGDVGTIKGVESGAASVTVSAEGVSASAAVTVSGHDSGSSAHVIPASIAGDCSVDVTKSLSTWIATVPDGSTLLFGKDACYNIDGGLIITDRHNLTFEGNGATFRVFSRGGRDRANWRFQSGSNLTLRNMIARGANPNAGLADAAYDTNVEGQHAFRFEGTQTAILDSVQAYDLWGDFVEAEPDWRAAFPGEPVRNLTVRNSRFERNGRMGIGLTHVDGFVLEDSYIGDVRWSAIDLELDDSREVGKNIRIERNHFGPVMHSIFVAKGAGLAESISNVVIRGNEMDPDYTTTCLAAISVATPGLSRLWSGWVIEDNILRVRRQGWAIEMTRTGQVTIQNNRIISGSVGGCGLDAPIKITASQNGLITGNSVSGPWPISQSIDSSTTGFTISDNVLER